MSTPTIGCVCHFHSERHALPSFIPAAKAMFDEVVLVSSPMDGTPHCEESLAIARASGCKVILDTLSDGFGALRTRCISYSSCDWVMILDADERISSMPSTVKCGDGPKFPDVADPGLQLFFYKDWFNPRQLLRDAVMQADAEGSLAVCLSRRHWLTAPDGERPQGERPRAAQSWHQHPDWQLRLLKNTQWLCYDPEVKMHEKLLDTRTWQEPKFLRVVSDQGPFIEHHSVHFKNMEPEQNAEDVRTYEALAPGCVKDMWLEHFPKESSKPKSRKKKAP